MNSSIIEINSLIGISKKITENLKRIETLQDTTRYFEHLFDIKKKLPNISLLENEDENHIELYQLAYDITVILEEINHEELYKLIQNMNSELIDLKGETRQLLEHVKISVVM